MSAAPKGSAPRWRRAPAIRNMSGAVPVAPAVKVALALLYDEPTKQMPGEQ